MSEIGGPGAETGTELVQTGGVGHPTPSSPAYPAPPQLIESAPVSLREFVRSLAGDDAVEDQRALSVAYDRAVQALIGENDVQVEGGKSFKKKSAWRKLGRFFSLSTQLVSQSGAWIEEPNPLTGKTSVDFVALVTMRAVAPWGQYMEATAACSTRELRFLARTPVCPVCKGLMWDNRNPKKGEEWKADKGDFACRDKGCSGALAEGEYDPKTIGQLMPNPTAFSKARHDCMSTAQTRASNRAISDLIAAGEVSWEEVQGGDQKSYGGGKGSPEKTEEDLPFLDRKVGFGANHAMTWNDLLRENIGYVTGYVLSERCKKVDAEGKRILRKHTGRKTEEDEKLEKAEREGEAATDTKAEPEPDGGGDGGGSGADDVTSRWKELSEGIDVVILDLMAMKDPQVPNDRTQWKRPHIERAIRLVETHGWDKIRENLNVNGKKGEKEGGEKITAAFKAEMESVMDQGVKYGVMDLDESAEIEKLALTGKVKEVKEKLDDLKTRIFKAKSENGQASLLGG